jgi:sugar transferase (PEP-CTERM/EpsH1 system associated)
MVPRLLNMARGAAMLASAKPLTHSLLEAPAAQPRIAALTRGWHPDVVLVYCSGMAPLAMTGSLADVPFVLDMVDVDSAKWDAYARTSTGPLGWIYAREARCLAKFEADAMRHAHATVVVTERERRDLAVIAPGADIRVVGNGIDLDAFRPPRPAADEPRLVFAGVFSYRPNERGALWFAREVWPLVRAHRPDARLTLVGANPTPAIRGLAEQDETIEVTGTVPDVRPFIWRAAVAVAPLLEARGIQNKVLEALAARVPVVTTPAVAAGLPDEVLPGCRVAADPHAYAGAVLDLLSLPPSERRAAADRADLSALGWTERLAPLVPLLEAAASRQVQAAGGREQQGAGSGDRGSGLSQGSGDRGQQQLVARQL